MWRYLRFVLLVTLFVTIAVTSQAANLQDIWTNGSAGTAVSALGFDQQCRTSAGVLYGIDGWTSEAANVYIEIFDSATAVSSANPPVPWPKHIIEVDLPGNGNFGLTLPPVAEYFKNGIYIAVSTTAPPNFTKSASNKTHFNCQQAGIFDTNNP